MSQNTAVRPNCEKCGGVLVPSRNLITNRVESVACVSCGEALYRDYERRAPLAKEMGAGKGSEGSPRHDAKLRASA